MRKIACALLVSLVAFIGGVGAHAAHASSPQVTASRGSVMFSLTSATAAGLEAQQIFLSISESSRMSQQQKNKLLAQGAKLVKITRKLLDRAGAQPVTAAPDPQLDVARSLAVEVYRKALQAYRDAKAAIA